MQIHAQSNAIVAENALPGSPASVWDISGSGSLSIQGFATDISYNKGEIARFKIKTTASGYTVKVYRLGYYGGLGARFQGDGIVTATLPQSQSPCTSDFVDAANPGTGLLDCGNWAESANWPIPADAVSGIYIAKLTRNDDLTASSHIAFIVRDDASNSDLLFQTSDATWQAYNIYGDTETNGKSLYRGVSGGKASKVSYNRPFYTRAGNGGGGAMEDWLFNSEYPMLRFLEKNGYDVTYTTDIDSDRRGNLIANHKVFMSVGHDEYWSKGMRNNVTVARDAGTHLAFFSGNEVYWKTRYENSISTGNAPFRTLVCYKEGSQGENQCNGKCDETTTEWTGLWRSGCEFPGSDGCNPENKLSGQLSWDGFTGTMEVPSDYKNLRFWRNTSVAALNNGQTATLTANTLGYEWNPEQESYRSTYPAGRVILSKTIVNGKTHHLSLYKSASGALVFGAGTVQWSWGLDDVHDRGSEPVSPAMQQATVNLFADMNVQPKSLQSNLLAAIKSTDIEVPALLITSPTSGASFPANAVYTISGTASDNATVSGIEISTDGGTTWRLAAGTLNWTYAWTPTSPGAATIMARVVDDSGNLSPVTSLNVTVGAAVAQVCPCTVFLPTDVPGSQVFNDGQSIQLGMKFSSDVSGLVTGVRFYKNVQNIGTHTGQLYSAGGALLAQIVFSNETSEGWQQANFSSPIPISANTTYIISYHSSSGYYSSVNPYFTTEKTNGHLKGLADTDAVPNGVYKYSAIPTFPNENFQSSNYYVDVVFELGTQSDVTPPAIVSTLPASGTTNVNISPEIKITFNEALDAGTVSANTVRLLNGTTVVPASIAYDVSTLSATIIPTVALSYATTYTIEIIGGNADPRIKDITGNALAANYSATFTTRAAPVMLPSPNDGPGGPILVISSTTNPFSRYTVEILRAEGLNEFAAKDISEIGANPALLNNYDVILLGEFILTPEIVTALTNWVNAGGTLIAFKPDAQLNSLLGLTTVSGLLSDKYLKVNTATAPGTGIVSETIQFHGQANLYTLSGATSIATLYSNAGLATENPAVTSREVGSNGGKAVAFTYDLAKSIVYTRQGNPAWAGQKRDGQSGPIRSDDLFFPDWIDFEKVSIPQADEQQRLLANIILQGNLHKKPLPRFWYLPRKLKAAVIMTGDDHASGGTIGRFDDYLAKSSSNDQAAVDNWTAVRGTSYIYPNTPITNEQAANFQAKGFEIALHLNTNCDNYTEAGISSLLATQLNNFATQFPSLLEPTTNRTHCIAWSDWATQPKVELQNGIRLDANYYYWPQAWILDRPGMFTGSGMPMRFADLDGSMIDVYQAATQLTDESGINYATHINSLLDNAIGIKGYYGVFTANMHTDLNGGNSTDGSNAIITSAQSRNVPVISAKQMLTWLDGRNNSAFGNMSWAGNVLNFSITTASGSNNMFAMLPVRAIDGELSSITVNGSPVTFVNETIKGILYAFFPAASGNYVATYTSDNIPPQILNIVATQSDPGSVVISWTTNEPADSKVVYGTSPDDLSQNIATATLVTNHSLTITGLLPGTIYYYKVTSADAKANSTTEPGISGPLSFTTPVAACFDDQTASDFNAGNVGANTVVTTAGVSLKPKTEEFTTLPPVSEWQSFPWNNGGTSTIVDGQIAVDGARYNTEPETATFGPGTSIEFRATFGATPFQHIGFGAGNNVDMYNNTAIWAMFSTNNTSTELQARVANSSFDNFTIPNIVLGVPHTYRIDWNVNSIEFFIDGVSVRTVNINLSTPMRIGMSDYNVGGPALSMDWIRVTPSTYPASGSFMSRVYDAGTQKEWQQASWTADIPAGTSVQLFQRQGNSADPADNSWTTFTPIASSGATVGGVSRYIQYRADLTSSNSNVTPVLTSVSIDCAKPACPDIIFTPATGATLAAGTVSINYSQTISLSSTGFTFSASGLPAGLSINQSSGEITGKPTELGPFNVTVTATQGTCVKSAAYTLTISPNPLPVTLVSFTVVKDEKSALLKWSTSQETNSESFSIEHSLNAKNWNRIGTVLSKGESSVLRKYSFTDKNAANGENFYRLKMFDKDGTFTFSKIQSVTFDNLPDKLLVFPNPATDVLTINVGDLAKVKSVRMHNQKGNTVYSAYGNNVNKTIDIKSLVSGNYILVVVRKDGEVMTSKVVIIK
ncbi:DUF4082 domain-containing protein [Dyadobacter sp. CY345]|uniref:N,N-dimethylformamidase beta subunit family domain-containing protein n=1 Tax=Dyadobacter sp. CY345 TaxID=2909335 RepID=UPI001F445120|nr:N,N-dimethylformamidase beta subunit family domain-containing protein [Dyadobacter sp. CY345]MCF2447194.1 DUF4082 domain-containing protein [Dyadobacter sp. CY345]